MKIQNPSKINWGTRQPKRMADALSTELMTPTIERRTQPVSILSLPAGNWHWERQLTKSFPRQRFQFTGLEQDDAVYREAEGSTALDTCANVVHHDIKNLNVFEFVTMPKNKARRFDIVYLDWMGTWSQDKRAQAETLFEQNQVRSYFMCTIALNRGRLDLDTNMPRLLKRFKPAFPITPTGYTGKYTENFDRKTYGVAADIICAAQQHGVAIQPQLIHLYPSGTCNWEIQFLFKRTKKRRLYRAD